MSRSGRLFGVPEELLPRSYAQFEGYMHAMHEEVLEVGPQARALASEILSARAWGLGAPLNLGTDTLIGVLAAGLLPARLRAGYQLRWGRREQHAFATACLAARTAVPAVPARLRYWPHYLAAQRRLRQ
jgi:uncharacterized protein (DUF2236 family)